MDLKRLKTFVVVAEHGTISRAAQVLHITQPALSRQIGALEQELGFSLFRRAGRRLMLTAAGEHLLADCRSLLSHAAAVTQRAQSLQRGDIRVLKIVASAVTIEGFLPTFLHRYARTNPDVRLSLIEADASKHMMMLEQGEAHLSINIVNTLQLNDDRFGTFMLPQFQILATCSPPLKIGGSGASVEIRELVQHPLLLPHQSYATRQLFDAACQLAGVHPNILLESAAAHTLLALAEAGHGVAIIPSVLRPDRSRLRVMQVTHREEPLQIKPAVIWDKQRTLPRYADNFSQLLADHIRETLPISFPAEAHGTVAIKRRAVTKRGVATGRPVSTRTARMR